MSDQKDTHLIKFLGASLSFFFAGSIHGVVQLNPVVRAWLDSIGSPYGGPGHLIDPLAHAHINLIGGVMMLVMTITYYLLPRLTRNGIWSTKLMNFSFYGTVIGITFFYGTLMIFGIWMGELLLADDPAIDKVQKLYVPMAAISSTVMGIGLWSFLINALISIKNGIRDR